MLSDDEAEHAEQAARRPAAEEPTAERRQPQQAAKQDPQSPAGPQQSEKPDEAQQAGPPRGSQRARGTPPQAPGRRGPEETLHQPGQPPEPEPSRLPPAPAAEEVERTLGDEEAAHTATTGSEQTSRPSGEETAEATQPSHTTRRPPGTEEKPAGSERPRQAAKQAPGGEDRPRQAEQAPSAPEDPSRQATKPEESGAAQGRPPSEQAAGPEEAAETEAPDVADPGDTATTLPGVAAALEENPWQVEVTGGPAAGRRYVLGERTPIGRADDAAVHLPDPRVSRRHAMVEQVGEAYHITDLESANGTFVNDRRITEPTPLRPGDTIRIGRSELVVRA